jgi:RNA polymerase sigma-54 factor
MALEQKLSLKLAQKLVMTPSLQQAIKLLQMTRLELEGVLNQELIENPVLEEQDFEEEETPADAQETAAEKETPEPEDPFADIDLDAYFGEQFESWEGRGHSSVFEERQAPPLENTLAREDDLYDHLLWQLHMMDLPEEQREIAEAIIGNLDPDGFLVATVEEIRAMGCEDPGLASAPVEERAESGYAAEAVEQALELVQSLDPPGVACASLQESLLRQLDARGEAEDSLARRLVAEKWDAMTHRKFEAIARDFEVPLADLEPSVRLIASLDTRPGRRFSTERTHYVEPDVHIVKVGDDYVIQLNDNGLPRLRISRAYRRMLQAMKRRGSESEARQYIKEKMRSAMWLIKSLDQRQRTIYKVAKSIIEQQRAFLDHGVDHLRPMVLRDVAEDIDMHESTVSRVVSNKYMHTPRGLLPMKFFFHSGIDREYGGDISSLSVKRKIKQFIQEEDAKKPLSDSELMRILNREGIHIARRTVAKYRDELGIPSSTDRKRIF